MNTIMLYRKIKLNYSKLIPSIHFIKYFMFLLFLVICSYRSVIGNSITLECLSYQTETDTSYKAKTSVVEKMSYGRANIGPVKLDNSKGTINKWNDDIDAYSSTRDLTIQYGFEGNFKSNGTEKWNITSDGGKVVNNINLNKKIQDGSLIIRKSYDNVHWDHAIEPITNFFSNKKIDRTNLYTIPYEDLLKGTYYEVTVAYKIERKVGEDTGFLWIKTPKMAYRYCG